MSRTPRSAAQELLRRTRPPRSADVSAVLSYMAALETYTRQLESIIRAYQAAAAAQAALAEGRTMKMTELQFAGMTISLSTLGQVDLSDNDSDMLTNLAFLLEQAQANVAKALAAQRVEADAARYEQEHGEPPF